RSLATALIAARPVRAGCRPAVAAGRFAEAARLVGAAAPLALAAGRLVTPGGPLAMTARTAPFPVLLATGVASRLSAFAARAALGHGRRLGLAQRTDVELALAHAGAAQRRQQVIGQVGGQFDGAEIV